MRNLILLFLLFISIVTRAQSWQWARAETASGEGMRVCNDLAGNAYLAGTVNGSYTISSYTLTGSSPFIIKYDPNGNLVWLRNFSGSGCGGLGVTCDNGNNVFLTGWFSGAVTIGNTTLTSFGGTDIFTIKYDAAGNVLWARSAGGNVGGDLGVSVSTDTVGNCFVTGSFSSSVFTFGTYSVANTASNSVGACFFIAKYDPNGNELWVSTNQSGQLYPNEVHTDVAGNAIVCGYTTNSVTVIGNTTLTSNGGYDILLVKYSTNGNLIWAKNFGGVLYDNSNSVNVDKCGNIFLAGYFNSPSLSLGTGTVVNTSTNYDSFIAMLDNAGTPMWLRSVGGTDNELGYDVATDGSRVFMCGSQISSFMVVGSSTITAQSYIDSSFLVQYDYSGNLLYVTGIGCGGDDQMAISVDNASHLYFGGDIFNACTLGPSSMTVTGAESPFMARLNYTPYTYSLGISGNSSICSGQTTTLVASGASSYSWTNGPSTASFAISPTITTQYSLVASPSGGCSNVTAYQTVTVLPAPSLSVSASSATVCKGNKVTLSYTCPVTATWSPGASTINNLTLQPSSSLSYTCISTSSNNCSSTKTISITVNPCTGLSENSSEAENLTVFPNPANDNIKVMFDSNGPADLLVLNTLGEVVYKKNSVERGYEINLSGWATGVYFIKIRGHGNEYLCRFVKI